MSFKSKVPYGRDSLHGSKQEVINLFLLEKNVKKKKPHWVGPYTFTPYLVLTMFKNPLFTKILVRDYTHIFPFVYYDLFSFYIVHVLS